MSGPELIYLDHNATTPLDPRVYAAMQPYFLAEFGNAASRHHVFGRRAAEAVATAGEQVARTIGADPREIVWTSGATESNNLALKGLAKTPAYAGKRHLLSLRSEHRAVLDPCRHLEGQGFELTLLDVDAAGLVDLDELSAAIRDDTLVVSVMHANSETGVMHPIDEIGARCRQRGVLFHTDATQSFGKEPIDVEASHIDLLSFSAHKCYGPKGSGGLFIRRRQPRVRCETMIHGGGHQGGRRSGTLNVPGIVGLGRAAELCLNERDSEQPRIRTLRDQLETRLLAARSAARVNGAEAPRLANTCNISFPGTDAEAVIAALRTVAISTASACASAALQPSYVLRALGLDAEQIRGSLRISLGRFTTTEQIDGAAAELLAALAG